MCFVPNVPKNHLAIGKVLYFGWQYVELFSYELSYLCGVDAATRDSSMDILSAINVWLKGPEYILRDNELLDEDSDDFPLIEPENDKEIRPKM
jgi:hypothetical protein